MTMSASRANGEYFADFFEQRMSEQSRDLAALRRAAGNSDDADGSLRHLVERVVGHYEYYYRAKAASARCDVLPMFSPTWTSSTENLFLWAGGWRPSTAFHLLYSKSGLQLEAELDQILLDWPMTNLGILSSAQSDRPVPPADLVAREGDLRGGGYGAGGGGEDGGDRRARARRRKGRGDGGGDGGEAGGDEESAGEGG